MTMASDGKLWVERVGMTEDQARRALTAAHKSLAAAGAGIDEAFEASWQPEAHEFDESWQMSKECERLYDAWWAAADAASKAAQLEDEPWTGFYMFPAEVGRERHEGAIEACAPGRCWRLSRHPIRARITIFGCQPNFNGPSNNDPCGHSPR